MGGKKKKGMSNRLAKMSDEERARYLQHRAQLEEEAKRRKEQLIATYMKNKVKREDAFTRLNIAKINEHWHQILRKVKCKQLLVEIQDLSTWITKVVDVKNATIQRLMVEIQEAEKHYQINLHSHISHVDNFIGYHHERQEYLRSNFEIHKFAILSVANDEMGHLKKRAEEEEKYLRTVLFGMQKKFESQQAQIQTQRESKLEDYSTMLRSSMQAMITSYSVAMDKIWHNISHTLRDYLNRTVTKRHHYIDLKFLDDRNIVETTENEQRIAKLTALKVTLAEEHAKLLDDHEQTIATFTEEQAELTTKFNRLRRNLTINNRRDEKQMITMTAISNAVIKSMEKLKSKGESVKQLAQCCRRLETEEEKLVSWAIAKKNYADIDIFEELLKESSEEDITDLLKTAESSELDTSKILIETEEGETIKDESEANISESTEESSKVLTEFADEYKVISKLEGLVWCHNRVELDCMELKAEKCQLISENRRLKEAIRCILEEAAMEPASTPDPAKYIRSKVVSAPVTRNSGSWKSQVPNCVVLEF